jgi:hypothetical protein
MIINRRDFLRASSAAAFGLGVPAELSARPTSNSARANETWDAGSVLHILPQVSDTRMLVKASFKMPLVSEPSLHIGNQVVRGRMSDTRGEHWQFHATGLRPGRRHRLALTGRGGRALCEPWQLSTFPRRDERPQNVRILFFTCAGGHEALEFLPSAVRNRLLRRALSFGPDAAVANGDHIYWDQLSPLAGRYNTPEALALAGGRLDRSGVVLGGDNEGILKRIGSAQIVSIYRNDFRSVPMFFLQDDHDYFENDDADDNIITFPPSYFMLQLARATQNLYYPEFLPDAARPAGLPWSSAGDRAGGISECFGTLRYGRLVEVLLYDIRRTATLAGPSAVYVDVEAEKWLHARTAATEVAHLIHAPSNPPGWSAGKWGEWYPDVLCRDNKLTVNEPKPYWQPGWLKQHDRLMEAMAAMKRRAPLVISGDMHAIALGRMLRSGKLDFRANPINAVLSGPIGTRPGGWPSGRRGTGALPPVHLDMAEQVKPIEQHGFTIVDFTPDKMVLRLFKWDVNTQPVEAIDRLEPFHTAELARPV